MPEATTGGAETTREPGRAPRHWRNSFSLIGAVMGIATIAEVFADRWQMSDSTAMLGACLALTIGAATMLLWLAVSRGRATLRLFSSLEFASASMLVILLETALGTFVLQKAPTARFEEVYGGLVNMLRALQVDDLFHSFAFVGLLGVFGIGMGVTAVVRASDVFRGRRKSRRHLGFAAVHGSIAITLLGGLVTMLTGQKGHIDLVKGTTVDRYVLSEPTPDGPRTADLGFSVRLDDFQLEYHEGGYKLYVYQVGGRGPDGRMTDVEPKAALAPEKGEKRVFGDGYELHVDEFLKPKGLESGTPHELVIDGKHTLPITVGATVTLQDGAKVRALRFVPHFNYDIQQKRVVSRSQRPENPALQVELTSAGGGDGVSAWLFADNPGFTMGGQQSALAKRVAYRYARPQVIVTLSQKGAPLVEKATLPLGASGPLPIEGGQSYFVSFQEKRDSVKQYHSTISILEGDKVVLDRVPLSVNHPVSHRGVDLYQSNYRWWDLDYSGIQVVTDPGLPIVYAGMIVMMFGVCWVLVLRRRGRTVPGDADAPSTGPATSDEEVAA